MIEYMIIAAIITAIVKGIFLIIGALASFFGIAIAGASAIGVSATAFGIKRISQSETYKRFQQSKINKALDKAFDFLNNFSIIEILKKLYKKYKK
ncbi:MAG: hypothetical protein IKZ25_03020 [Clostridia bacterium]|nr:hypothetical protein [Clostridia bacterium]